MRAYPLKKLLIFSCLVVALCGCSPTSDQEDAETAKNQTAGAVSQEEPVSRDIFAMDTYMTLTAYGEQAEKALDAAEQEITRIEKMVSTGISTSEIARINANGRGTVSEDTAYLIRRSQELYKDTDGCFDITIYPVMRAWGFTTGDYRVPEEAELSALLQNVDAAEITCEDDNVSVEKTGMEIDLGGIAKGYTSSRVIELMKDSGVEHAVISLGGNVQVLGQKPDGTDWKIAVEDPSDTSDYLGVIETSDKAVITSGGYERYFEENGKKYHHIIDPSTGYPADSGLTSVTIISDDGTLADGLSTALFIMGKDRAIEYWRSHSTDFDAILVEEDGSISVTAGLKDNFTSERKWEVVEKE